MSMKQIPTAHLVRDYAFVAALLLVMSVAVRSLGRTVLGGGVTVLTVGFLCVAAGFMACCVASMLNLNHALWLRMIAWEPPVRQARPNLFAAVNGLTYLVLAAVLFYVLSIWADSVLTLVFVAVAAVSANVQVWLLRKRVVPMESSQSVKNTKENQDA